MTGICRELFKAIHEGKWLSVEYKNKSNETTRYWIAVKELDPRTGRLTVDGLHLGQLSVAELCMYVERIQAAHIVDGSYCAINEELVEDIQINPQKYAALFSNIANLRILDYLVECNKLDSTPYKTEYALIMRIDDQRLACGEMPLDEAQFHEIVNNFQRRSVSSEEQSKLKVKQLGMNLLSINTREGLYVLAYQPLVLDVKNRMLRTKDEPVICKEFTVNGSIQSIRQFLDADDYGLLEEFSRNLETIRDRITQCNQNINGVDDMPYIVAIGRDCQVDLEGEYKGILNMYDSPDGEAVTAPIRAFFGDLTGRTRRRKSFPLALLNQKVNLDQLLAMSNAMRYQLTYVQGPPGTGKTNTIINTITTAFFNERTVLFTSYNNHPIDGVFRTLQTIKYRENNIPFPMVRLGNNDKVKEALRYIRRMYERVKDIRVFEETLDRNKQDRAERAKKLTALLERYEVILDLHEREETIERLLESQNQFNFQYELQAGQLPNIKAKLLELGSVTTEDALPLLDHNENDFLKYLYYTSARYIQRLGEPKNKELLDILYQEDENDRALAFSRYLSDKENVKKFQRIFPVVATTCISAHKLAGPEPLFDMVIMDEASQCNTAMSLVPIVRGSSLMLVGDPQQLSPVILLDQKDNETLRGRYGVTSEYDYIANSIYKVFLACDSVSDEVLLSYHYRCHPKIIEFNNRKYYNRKLHIASQSTNEKPLMYVEVPGDISDEKNVAPQEARCIVDYVKRHPEQKIGIVTPFTKQKRYINQLLTEHNIFTTVCGTVHAFQGDEKDVILFSLALTDRTRPQTYNWLKNNKELINVATSRAKDQLIVFSNQKELDRLHDHQPDDDIYELVQYVRTNGFSQVTEKVAASRALGVKPYSTKTEEAFLENLHHALDNAFLDGSRCVVHKEVPIAQVFQSNSTYTDLFYTGRFDFVVYQREGKRELPILAIELDGKEHVEDAVVRERDRKKEAICREHGFELIRVENSYARRYHYIKDILIRYFAKK